jgi:hypothetical protein
MRRLLALLRGLALASRGSAAGLGNALQESAATSFPAAPLVGTTRLALLRGFALRLALLRGLALRLALLRGLALRLALLRGLALASRGSAAGLGNALQEPAATSFRIARLVGATRLALTSAEFFIG